MDSWRDTPKPLYRCWQPLAHQGKKWPVVCAGQLPANGKASGNRLQKRHKGQKLSCFSAICRCGSAKVCWPLCGRHDNEPFAAVLSRQSAWAASGDIWRLCFSLDQNGDSASRQAGH